LESFWILRQGEALIELVKRNLFTEVRLCVSFFLGVLHYHPEQQEAKILN